jgi:type II secretory pathway pseudopilin PulG
MRRRGFTLFQLLVVLAILALLLGLFLPAVQKVREAAARSSSMNNLKQIAIAAHAYHDAYNRFPSGLDANGFSAAAYLLPFIEQQALYNRIDFKQKIDAKANAAARGVAIKVFLSPLDGATSANADYGATNYLFNAGSKPDLKDNDGVFYLDSKLTLAMITNGNGTSNTIMAGETLKGDGGIKAVDVHRQHVALKAEDLKNLTPEVGVKRWKAGDNIAGDRGASWMDGRFLQGTFTGTLAANDERPDVSCDGLGGLSGLRSEMPVVLVAMCDGSARPIRTTFDAKVWGRATSWKNTEPLPKDF